MIDWYLSHAGRLANFSLQMLITCAILQGCKKSVARSRTFLHPLEQIFTSQMVTWLKLFSDPSKDSYLINLQIMIDWYSFFGRLVNFSLQTLITCAILQGCKKSVACSQTFILLSHFAFKIVFYRNMWNYLVNIGINNMCKQCQFKV